MQSCRDIQQNRFFSNGGPNLHIKKIAQSCPEDNPAGILQGPLRMTNQPKYLVPLTIHRYTAVNIGRANGRTSFNDGKMGSGF